MAHNQFELLRQRRFLPYFSVQALGAFNDNVYRQAIIGMLVYMAVDSTRLTLYSNLAPALFILPYFLFSALAGQIAEKLEKQKLIVMTTLMEIAIMSVAAIGFLTQSMPVLLTALFLTGTQSTLFGPVKYSILPSVLKPEELTGGNGLVEMGTSISILLGMLYGGLIFQLAGENGYLIAAISVVGLALAGQILAWRIPKVDAGMPQLRLRWNLLAESMSILRLTRKQPAVRNAVLGVSWFWFVGTLLTAQLPAYAGLHLGAGTLYLLALGLFSVGVGAGSLLCEKLSGRIVEIGLVPLGAFGISAFLLDLYFARPQTVMDTGLSLAEFVRTAGNWRIIVDLTAIGVFVGIFVVPLFALIQSRTPKTELARVIAGLNIQNSLFIVLAAVVGIVLQLDGVNVAGVRIPLPGLDIPQVFLTLAIANAVAAIYIFSIVPEFFMRFLSWLMVRTLYRLRVDGVDRHVPDTGAALIVCNHVSYMDALILAASIPRPVRFVMDHRIFNIPVLRWMFRTAKAIPIASAKDNAALMESAFDQIDAALREGEMVCIFPEGRLTTDGNLGPFRPGVERILTRAAEAGWPVPVIPMALRGMWSSMWSRRNSTLGRMRIPRRLRARVEVVAGAALADASVRAEQLQTQVSTLHGEMA